MSDSTDDRLDAARHEAGHAVIGMSLGKSPVSIYMRHDGQMWLGACSFGKGKVGAKELVKVGAAGVLSHAKSNAIQSFGQDIRFVRESDLSTLLGLLKDSNRSGPIVDAGSCDLDFLGLADGSSRPHKLDGRWFSGVDAGMFRLGAKNVDPPFDSVVVELLRQTMAVLDNRRNWSAVVDLAERLQQQQPSGEDQRFALEGEPLARAVAAQKVTPFDEC